MKPAFCPIFCGYMVLLSFAPFLHFCFFLFDMLKYLLWGPWFLLIFFSCLEETGCHGSNGFEWLKIWILLQFLQCLKILKGKMASRASIIGTILCPDVWFTWNHTKLGSSRTYKPNSGAYHGQFMIFMQPYVAMYDFLFISCFCMVVIPGLQ